LLKNVPGADERFAEKMLDAGVTDAQGCGAPAEVALTAKPIRQTFPSVDKVGNLTVFNIGGNKARLIAAIHYNTHRIYIRHILTHEESMSLT
jgi:hypothetical protein